MFLRKICLLFFIPYVVCDPSVIIIGAGASGIAAATRLLKNGFTNITVLEAEDRIGGRIYSVEFGKGYVDLGAEWCHGEKCNIVYDMVKDLDILRVDPAERFQIYHSELKKIDENFADGLLKAFVNIYNNHDKNNGSLGDYIMNMYGKIIGQWKDDLSKYTLAQQLVDFFESYVGTAEGAFSWFDLVANNDYQNCNGGFDFIWNGLGYKTILDIMMEKYPDQSKSLPIDDKILLKKRVEVISWVGEKAVVKCMDGLTYSSDHVVVTVSLGVLKHDHSTLFDPKLPVDKVQAINQLGIAAVHKVLIHFSKKWWNDADVFGFVWDNKTQLSHVEGPVKNGKSWITSLAVVASITYNPNVLEAWFAGTLIPDVEQTSDQVVVNGIINALTHFGIVDSKDLLRPNAVVRYNWYTNPHFRGTYSFQTPRSRRGENSDEVILSKPLGVDLQKPTLLFAGEATNPTHYSTVHGAIETGFREADRIIQMYKKVN